MNTENLITNALQQLADRDFSGIKVKAIFNGAVCKIVFYETNAAIQRVMEQHTIMLQESRGIEWEIQQAPRKWAYELDRYRYQELEYDLLHSNPDAVALIYRTYSEFRNAWLKNLEAIKVAPIRETIVVYEPAPKKPSLLKRFLKTLDKLTTPPVETIEYKGE